MRRTVVLDVVGLTSALIYTPDVAFTTDELVALAAVAAQKGGLYAAHIRNEGARLGGALDEMIDIARRARVPKLPRAQPVRR